MISSFRYCQLFENIVLALKTGGEAHEKAMEKVHRNLKLLEEGMRGCFPGGFPSIAGESDNMGLLDIVVCSIFGPHEAYEEFFGVKIIDQEKYPLLSFWLKSLLSCLWLKSCPLLTRS